MLSRPGSLAGGMLMRPMVPFEPEEPPDLARTRVLISAGQHDPMVPRHQTERLATLLKAAGADVTLSWFDTGHGLISPELDAAARWFAEHKA
jgi:predicted esterase